MKRILAFLQGVGLTLRPIGTYHDDSLRANQGDRSTSFSFWRALVS